MFTNQFWRTLLRVVTFAPVVFGCDGAGNPLAHSKTKIKTTSHLQLPSPLRLSDSQAPIIDLPASDVCSDQVFRNAKGETTKGTRVCDVPATCTAEGQTNCVASATYPAVEKAGLSAKVIAQQTIAGVVGTAVASQNCSSNFQQDCLSTSSYRAVDTTNLNAANIRSNVVIAGLTGTYPSSQNLLVGATGDSDLTSMAASTAAGSYEWFNPSGERMTGTIVDAGTITPSTSDQSFSAGVYRTFTVLGDGDLVVAKVKNGVDLFGAVGTYPSSGNLLPGSDSTADLDQSTLNAKLKSSASFEWYTPDGTRQLGNGDVDLADDTKIKDQVSIFGTVGSFTGLTASASDAWDIRKGVSVGGVAGKLRTNCRNGISTETTPTYNYDGLVANITDSSYTNGSTKDWWDTVNDYNAGSTTPLTYAAVSPTAWSADNLCGGKTTDPDDDNVWLDLTSGTCNDASDDCVFKDKISGLYWSEVLSSTYTWSDAIRACKSLNTAPGFAGYQNWRVPTIKELLDASVHGIVTAATTNWNSTMSSSTSYWSSTTSAGGNGAIGLRANFGYGTASAVAKTTASSLMCVRTD